MGRIVFYLIIFLLVLIPDLYIYFSKTHLAFPTDRGKQIGKLVYFSTLGLQYGGIAIAMLLLYVANVDRNIFINFLVSFFFGMFLVKAIAIIPLLLLGDAYKAGEWLTNRFGAKADSLPPRVAGRRTFIKQLAVLISSVPFLYMLYGISFGKYNYQVKKVTLKFKDLPKAFHGFRLAQISDFHAGSFDSLEGVEKGLQLLQKQGADLIVFTGDLVNEMADEVDPFIDVFQKVNAPFGKYACLGNHDYGYRKRESRTDENLMAVRQRYADCGLELLNNRNVKLEKDGESIRLVGVENWSTSRHFPKAGDLDLALQDTTHNDFKILLSHDPTHFDAKVVPNPNPVHLTLSGHTHGTQLGVKLLGKRWSPAQYQYKQWAGLYEEAGKYIYVNKGFGMLRGFAFRVGMYPEITVIELQQA